MTLLAPRHRDPAPPEPARAPRHRMLRAAVQHLLLFPLLRALCGRIRVIGREHIPKGAVLIVANHQSHADTVALLRALPRRVRARTAVAAAEDYFFRGRLRGIATAVAVGAFPFPRNGAAGLDRAAALLDAGRAVLMFPQGTREGGGFKPGAATLAGSAGVTVVPAGIAGTADVLPKGRILPRCAPVAVAFGAPVRVSPAMPARAAAAYLASHVDRLAAAATLSLGPRVTWHARAARLARSRRGLTLAFCWGIAEALFLPIVPDVPVALLALAAPVAFPQLALAAAAGSVTGGALAWGVGALGITPPMLLVTERMHVVAGARQSADGAAALWSQPWSGIPYKVFGFGAAAHGVALVPFLAMTAAARGLRLVEVGAAFALAGLLGRRLVRRAYAPIAVAFMTAFALGLARVVGTWS